MATGASTADLALVVVDASTGLQEQTRRHCCIAALLGVLQLVVCANKMDLTGWTQSAYEAVVTEITSLAQRLGVESLTVIPISALHGDNVVERSAAAPWYEGPTVLESLETAPVGMWNGPHTGGTGARLPVQWVLRHPGAGRTYAGMVSGGSLRPGDEVVVLPSGKTSVVTTVETMDGPLDEAPAGLSVSVRLADDIDVSRGDTIALTSDPPQVVSEIEATVCWFSERPLVPGSRFRVKHTTRIAPASVTDITGRLDVNTLHLDRAERLEDNDIGTIRLTVGTPLAVDPYLRNRITGSFVLIDAVSNATVAAGMIGSPGAITGAVDIDADFDLAGFAGGGVPDDGPGTDRLPG